MIKLYQYLIFIFISAPYHAVQGNVSARSTVLKMAAFCVRGHVTFRLSQSAANPVRCTRVQPGNRGLGEM